MGVTAGTTLKKIRASHHRLAQLIASGTPQVTCATLVGYTTARVTQLMSDPAFIDLVAHYSKDVRAEWGEFVEQAASLSVDFLELLREQLDETPEKFTPTVALEAIKVLADRSGHAPVTKTLNVNVNQDMGRRMMEAEGRLRAARLLSSPSPDGSCLDAEFEEATHAA